MTYARREEIFSKETMSIKEVGEVMNLSYQMAARLVRNIKRTSNRPQIQGVLLIEDFFDYYGITDKQRYVKPMDEVKMEIVSVESFEKY
jgi:hypothetical protein